MASHSHAPDVRAELDRFTRACREQGTPVTHQRLAVYRALLESPGHPDAETVHRQLRPEYPTLSAGTVYKTLEMLEGLGLVKKVGATGPSRRFDANRHPHHHLWCVRCHSLTDIELDAGRAVDLPADLGFQVIEYTIQFSGVCAQCRVRGDAGLDPDSGAPTAQP
ncbi:MAG: Fur family transcriptional regulator [Candidatus Eisenbacteria bacterium]